MESDLESRVSRKLMRRIVPFVMLLYFISFLDRVNIGFAAITMNKAIGLSPTAFGLGGGLFFIGYFLFEVPSNLILHRVGARVWIARVMISWGIVSAASAFVVGPTSFYLLRFLLGVAEAGFFPGIILYWGIGRLPRPFVRTTNRSCNAGACDARWGTVASAQQICDRHHG